MLLQGISIEFFFPVVPIHPKCGSASHRSHDSWHSCTSKWFVRLYIGFVQLKRMLGFFFAFFGFSSIKVAHNDAKAGRKRHIQLRQRLLSLACKNKHRQTHTYVNSGNVDWHRFSVCNICDSPRQKGGERKEEKKEYVVMYSTYCIRLADNFVQVCNVLCWGNCEPIKWQQIEFSLSLRRF